MTDPIEEVFRKHGKHAWKGSAEYTLGDFKEAVEEILAEERKKQIVWQPIPESRLDDEPESGGSK